MRFGWICNVIVAGINVMEQLRQFLRMPILAVLGGISQNGHKWGCPPPILNPLLNFGGKFRGLKLVPLEIKVNFDQQK